MFYLYNDNSNKKIEKKYYCVNLANFDDVVLRSAYHSCNLLSNSLSL